jgi:hypothetical protein
METLPIKVSRFALDDIAYSFIPQDTSHKATVELVISIDDSSINVREFAAYVSLIDRVYGRLSPKGLNSYAHSESGQLEITEIRKGSIELIISQVVSEFRGVAVLIVLWQVLKQIPHITAAFKDYQEGMLARQNRKRIKQEMKQEEALKRLKAKRFNELVTLVNTLLTSEHKHLAAPIRFARTRVRLVTIKIREEKKEIDYTPRERKIAFDDEDI